MLFQLIGAIAGAAVIYILFKSPMNPPAPNVGFSNAVKPLLIEMIFTFAWVMVMLYTNASAKSSGNSYFGLAVGFVVMAGIVAAGPLSGACFNPAYALGSMIMDSVLGGTSIGNSWFYLMGQFAGGILAAVVHGMANPDEN
jgi:aquaporin Z